MSTKKERLDAICGIIQTKVISNQEELLKELEDSGFSVTQATLCLLYTSDAADEL